MFSLLEFSTCCDPSIVVIFWFVRLGMSLGLSWRQVFSVGSGGISVFIFVSEESDEISIAEMGNGFFIPSCFWFLPFRK